MNESGAYLRLVSRISIKLGMILACPSCATKFTIPDDVLAAGKRRVRCTRCRHVWAVGGEVAPESAPSAMPNGTPSEMSSSVSVETLPASFSAALTDIAPDLNIGAQPKAATRSSSVLSRLQGIWQGFKESKILRQLLITPQQAKIISIVLAVAILALLLAGRHRLTARSQALADLYAMTGVQKRNTARFFDLALTRAEKCFVSGRDMLCFEGLISHKGQMPEQVPMVKITAYGVDGQPLIDKTEGSALAWTIQPKTGKMLPGEVRDFSLTAPYPDQTIADFDYDFTDNQAQDDSGDQSKE